MIQQKTKLISKVELEKINRAIASQMKCKQWCIIQTVVDWFKSISNKTKARFTIFDSVEFYHSITEKLLVYNVSYIQTRSDDIIQLIKQARRPFLFTEGNIWMKKGRIA